MAKSKSSPPQRRKRIEDTAEPETDDDGYDSSTPPFLPLEEQNNEHAEISAVSVNSLGARISLYIPKVTGKKIVSGIMFTMIGVVIVDALFTKPENRLLKPEASLKVLKWVQGHPAKGVLLLVFLLALAVILMIPLGTPLTLGCGYIYKGAYGWRLGMVIATIVSMGGSALGAVVCFLLGRYLMRDQVRKWIRKYPLFDAIDIGRCRVAGVSASLVVSSHTWSGSCWRTWPPYHGHALFDSHSTSRPRQLHVWNHFHGALLLCLGQSSGLALDDALCLYRSLHGGLDWGRQECR